MLMAGLGFPSIPLGGGLLITAVRWQKHGAAANILFVRLADGGLVLACIETEFAQGPLFFPYR